MVSGVKKVQWWLVIAVLAIVVAAGSAYAQTHQAPRTYTSDTAYTLQYNGVLWGDCWLYDGHTELVGRGPSGAITELDGGYVECYRVDTLPSDLPYSPYYNAADNESKVRWGDYWFGDCKGDTVISEIPPSLVRCSKLLGAAT